jgi:serine/threonine protein kinase
MNTLKICSGCQKPLEAGAPDGLCPECLLKAGLGTGVDLGPDSQAESGRNSFVAPSLEEVARLFPQLEILGFIGQGGMGAVYKARQKALDRVVALKILPPGIGNNGAFADRFTREAKALARLNHPGVVTIYEFGQVDGRFFFLMEFVDGMSLRHLLEVQRISAREALAIVPQICDALQYAHDQGIVHRDIKPENILLDRQGRVKVADFGLAKLVGTDARTPALSHPMGEGGAAALSAALTAAGKVMGTPQYMAPEQREHPTEVDHRADIYSLGVVFYQMLTGELPGRPIEAPSHTVQIDVRLDEVVLRALEKEPARRYQQISQVKTAVEMIGQSCPPAETSPLPADWRTWSSSQSQQVRDICSHLTEAERREWTLRGLLFGIWNAATFFVPCGIALFTSNPLNWVFPPIVLLVGLAFYPLWQRMTREFLASTRWARQQGIAPKSLWMSPRTVLVGRRGDKAVIHWRGVLLRFVMALVQLLLLLVAVRAILASRSGVLAGWFDSRYAGAALLSAAIFTGILLRRGLRMPVEQLPTLDGPGRMGPRAVEEEPKQKGSKAVLGFLAVTVCFAILGAWIFLPGGRLTTGDAKLAVAAMLFTTIFGAALAALGNRGSRLDGPAGRVRIASKVAARVIAAMVLTITVTLGVWVWLGSDKTESASFRCRVFEADAAQVDRMVPAEQRRTEAGRGWETSEISPETLNLLLNGMASKPGLLVDRQRTFSGWPRVADSWTYAGTSQADGAIGGGAGFLGVRRKDALLQVRIDYKLEHKTNTRDPLNVHILYEGVTPQTGILAFIVPLAGKDVTARHLVLAFEAALRQADGTLIPVSGRGRPVSGTSSIARQTAPGPRAPMDSAPARFEASVYELQFPKNRAAGLDAQALEAQAETLPDLEKALAKSGKVKLLHMVDQKVNLYEDTIVVATSEPVTTGTHKTVLGSAINMVTYQELGLMVSFSASTPASDSRRKGPEVQVSFKLAALGEGGKEMPPGLTAPNIHNIQVSHREVPRFGKPKVLFKFSPPGGGEKAPAVAFVVRYVFKEILESSNWQGGFDSAPGVVDVEAANQSVTAQPGGPWTARLPSGVTVELLGVAENPSLHRPWWRPDGSPMESAPYGFLGASVGDGPGTVKREIAVRVRSLPAAPVDVQWRFEPPCDSAGGGTPTRTGNQVADLRAIAVRVPAAEPTLTVRVGVSARTRNWHPSSGSRAMWEWVKFRDVAMYPKQPPTGTNATSFGPVIERVIATPDADDQGLVFFDMETGKSFKPPFPMTFHPNQGPAFVELTPELKQWIKARGVDVLLHLGEKTWDLMTLEMQEDFAGQLNEWETIAAEKVVGLFAKKDAEHLVRDQVPASRFGHGYHDGFGSFNAFRTRSNTIGVYQFEGVDNRTRRGVSLRYKVVQSPPAGAASPPADPRRFPAAQLISGGPLAGATTSRLTALRGEVGSCSPMRWQRQTGSS